MKRNSRRNPNGRLTQCHMRAASGLLASTAVTAVLGAALTTMPALLSWDEALAACDPAGGTNFVCSGANVTPQDINTDDAAVTTTPGFSVTTAGTALSISRFGTLSYIDDNASSLTAQGGFAADGLYVESIGDGLATPGSVTIRTAGTISADRYGIFAGNSGAGAVSVSATGPVTGGAAGIVADGNGTDVTVNATNVSGGAYGILAGNGGAGGINITATGAVTTTNASNGPDSGSGIDVLNGFSTTGAVTINAATVSGFMHGITATNIGTGAISVTATGTVTGVSMDGIRVRNAAVSTGAMSVSAAAVSGAMNGISAINSGSGMTSLTAAGAVTGTQNYGILAVNGVATFNADGTVATVAASNATDLTVNAASVSGGVAGIYAVNAGTSATSVTATGAVTGGSQDGIRAINNGTATGGMAVNAATVSGGGGGIVVTNNGGGMTRITATGTVTGLAGDGVSVNNTAAGGTGISVDVAAVTGGQKGISVSTAGTGVTSITATGTVTGMAGEGIYAFNNSLSTGLTIKAAEVSGTGAGIIATNNGSGTTSVTATGTVSSASSVGIFALQNQQGSGLAVNAAAVQGDGDGIITFNQGGGATRITATGDVTGTRSAGIFAVQAGLALNGDFRASGGTDLVVNAVNTSGRDYGVYAYNWGTGVTSVTTTGAATATGAAGIAGIVAFNEATATDVMVSAGSASSNIYGAAAVNKGTGATSVTVSGAAQGGTTGILAVNGQVALTDLLAGNPYPTGAAGTDLMVNANSATGGAYGIYAVNNGSGATNVTATGAVSGQTQYGILAVNDFSAASLTVNAAGVSGATAILVQNDGSGATSVTATGPVSGAVSDGINAFNGGTASSMTLNAASVTGIQYGINARNFGTGATSITTGGVVEGGTAAILATSAGQAITITTNGFVRNRSELSTDLAIDASGGAVAFTNAGGMTGTVRFGAGANTFANTAGWNTAGGTNEFGGGVSQLANAAGVAIFAAADGGVAETTAFNGLANFNNHGTFIMADGGANDRTTTSGNLSFEAGSVYAIDISGTNQSDRITANGQATLLAGSTLAVNVQGGSLLYGNRYTVLTADGGVSGRFGSVAGLPQSTAFLAMQDTYDANNAYIDVIKYRNFADAGLTANQISTGRGMDSMPTVGPLFNAFAGLMTDTQARAAFDQLSGEQHASASTVLVDDSRFVRSAAIDRLRSSFGSVGAASMPVMSYAAGGPARVPASTERFVLWGQAFGSWGRVNGDGNAASVRRSTGGFIIGGDRLLFDGWRVGLLGGYSNTSFSISARSSSGSSDNYHVSIYGGRQWGNLGLRTGAAYTWHDIGTSRTVAFAGFNDQLTASYRAQTAQVFGDLGYRIDMNSVAVEPFGSLAYVNLRTEGFREVGGAAALTSAGAKTGVTFTTLGLRASTDFALGSMTATARGTLGWRHAFGDTTPMSTFAFTGGSAFAIAGAPIAQNAAVVEAGLDLRLLENATFGVSYNGQFASRARDQSVKANLAVKF